MDSDRTKAQEMMIADGLPAAAIIPQEERAAAWKGRRLTKPRDLKVPAKDEDPATKALRKELAKAEEKKKADRLARLRELKEQHKPKEADMATKKSKTAKKSAAANARKPAKGAGKPQKAAASAPKGERGVRPGSKLEIIVGLLTRPEGCTTADVLKATEWPSVSMPQQAKAAGITLKKEKVDGRTVYRAA